VQSPVQSPVRSVSAKQSHTRTKWWEVTARKSPNPVIEMVVLDQDDIYEHFEQTQDLQVTIYTSFFTAIPSLSYRIYSIENAITGGSLDGVEHSLFCEQITVGALRAETLKKQLKVSREKARRRKTEIKLITDRCKEHMDELEERKDTLGLIKKRANTAVESQDLETLEDMEVLLSKCLKEVVIAKETVKKCSCCGEQNWVNKCLVPCGHSSFCQTCVEKLLERQECSICRQPIHRAMAFFR